MKYNKTIILSEEEAREIRKLIRITGKEGVLFVDDKSFFTEPADDFFGEWVLKDNNNEYTVIVTECNKV